MFRTAHSIPSIDAEVEEEESESNEDEFFEVDEGATEEDGTEDAKRTSPPEHASLMSVTPQLLAGRAQASSSSSSSSSFLAGPSTASAAGREVARVSTTATHTTMMHEPPATAALRMSKHNRAAGLFDKNEFSGPEYGKWIDSPVIVWANLRIKTACPEVQGLQDPARSESTSATARFAPVPRNTRLSVQILNVPGHWVWLAQAGDTIFYGDTHRQRARTAHADATRQMTLLFPDFVKEDKEGHRILQYSVLPVQQQEDCFSCGVFTLAAVALIASEQVAPADMGKVAFDTSALWGWITSCWESDTIVLPPYNFNASCSPAIQLRTLRLQQRDR